MKDICGKHKEDITLGKAAIYAVIATVFLWLGTIVVLYVLGEFFKPEKALLTALIVYFAFTLIWLTICHLLNRVKKKSINPPKLLVLSVSVYNVASLLFLVLLPIGLFLPQLL